jgi:hypothetical protein
MKKALDNKKVVKNKIKRPGVHSKKKTSSLKTSKHYSKPYRAQGR